MHSKLKHVAKKYLSSAALLQGAGLRPTQQRIMLAKWLFDGCDKHVTAEQVHAATLKMKAHISLATVYNTLNTFKSVGLLRQLVIDGSQVYFDTNVGDHHHIFEENSGKLIDVGSSSIRIAKLPKLPPGQSLSRIDVIIRVRA